MNAKPALVRHAIPGAMVVDGARQRRVVLTLLAMKPQPGRCAVQVAEGGAGADLHGPALDACRARRVQPLGLVATAGR